MAGASHTRLNSWRLPPVEAVLTRVAVLIETGFPANGPGNSIMPIVNELASVSKALVSCSERLADARDGQADLRTLTATLAARCDTALNVCTANFREHLLEAATENRALKQSVSKKLATQNGAIEGLDKKLDGVSDALAFVGQDTRDLCQGIEVLGLVGESQANRNAAERMREFFVGSDLRVDLSCRKRGTG